MNKKHAKEIIADDPDKIAGFATVIEELAEAVLEEEKTQESVSSLQGWISDKLRSIKSLSGGINTEGMDRKDERAISRNP